MREQNTCPQLPRCTKIAAEDSGEFPHPAHALFGAHSAIAFTLRSHANIEELRQHAPTDENICGPCPRSKPLPGENREE